MLKLILLMATVRPPPNSLSLPGRQMIISTFLKVDIPLHWWKLQNLMMGEKHTHLSLAVSSVLSGHNKRNYLDNMNYVNFQESWSIQITCSFLLPSDGKKAVKIEE